MKTQQPVILNTQHALPDKVAPGDTLEVQLAPYGTFPGLRGSERVNQICDDKAFKALVANFSSEVLVDFEHHAELGGDTKAAAWVQSLRVDPDRGLLAIFRFTDIGATAVTNRQLRFLSPVWTLDDTDRPQQLISVGLTNKPNLPVRPLLNRAPAGLLNVEEKEKRMKEQLIAILGLDPETTDDAIIEAVSALQQKCAAADEAALNAEAEACAEENADKIQNKEAFKALYVQNREAAKQLIACIKAPAAVTQPVCNKAAARPPASLTEQADADKVILNKWQAMPAGTEKDLFALNHHAALLRATQNKD